MYSCRTLSTERRELRLGGPFVLIFSFLGAIAEVVHVFGYVWAVARNQDRLDVGWPRNDRFPNLRIANLRGRESMTQKKENGSRVESRMRFQGTRTEPLRN